MSKKTARPATRILMKVECSVPPEIHFPLLDAWACEAHGFVVVKENRYIKVAAAGSHRAGWRRGQPHVDFYRAPRSTHCGGLIMVKAKIKTVSRITNASALARELGVTREHLWRVVTGRRESRRLAAKLRKRGIKVEGKFEPATLREAFKPQGKGGK